MKWLAGSLLLFWIALVGLDAAATEAPTSREAISGRAFQAIEKAIPELEKHGFNVTSYRVSVTETPTWIAVTFTDPALRDEDIQRYAGCASDRLPCFEVDLDPADLHITAAQFIR